ncbi:MAG: DNA-directed RNA polymerase subunit beta' [Candidatus Atribacteria bacterium]|nr:DNA-directed RNA polymerase subunit beta' [Candidatus Atribacteria bacterium]
MEISKRINAITIGLASPEDIRKWSHGEVKKPETINYRTLKPEKDGLFCERIFGPVKDWECSCGKYKRVRYKGVICDRCGVEVTKSITRRERMGHIDLACPVSHVWYFKGIPSPLALLLNIPPKNLEKILYFAPDRRREQLYEAQKFDDSSENNNKMFFENGVITETEFKIHKMYNPNFNAELLYRVKQTKIFPHKVGDVITNKELSELQEVFGSLFFTVEPYLPLELKQQKGEYDLSGAGFKADETDKVEEEQEKSESAAEKISETGETIENNEKETEVDYRILEIDGLISESKLSPLIEKEQGLAKKTTMAKRTVEESCYAVINPRNTNHKVGDTILESENRLHTYYDPEFKAGIGAEAIRAMLKDINLDSLNMELREELKHSSGQKAKKIIRRLQIIDAFRKSNGKPEWMILDVLPVIPPDLRPMVQLEGGRFATSDLNDLYRRVINRNNRLKRLLELGAPGIIVKNEKRMLQEAVDALIDNGRRGHAVLGAGNRPLKSLSDLLQGKKGRFRQNLLGKRVDYSGRSVIVVGPKLRLYECGIPKKMALELFKPFIMHNLVKRELAHNIKTAKKLVEQESLEVWNILQEIVEEHPVLLNRAPTLHRLGIQVFKPILVEGNAIQLHPLACPAFNADFDGDQMAVHVPLSIEAQTEAEMLMLASNNVLSPANGTPIALPSQDIILGCYYLTMKAKGAKVEKSIFANPEEAIRAQEDGYIDIHTVVKVRVKGKIEETTIGRILFNQVLPEDFKFVDLTIDKKGLARIISYIYRQYGQDVAVNCLDDIKELGFHYATISGITIGIVDLEIPSEKERILEEAEKNVAKIREQFNYGLIMEEERIEKIINAWTDAADEVISAIIGNLSSFNPLYTMVESGARGSRRQIGQLAGMRGLMADPSGKIIEFPIRSNFREGLSCLEYFISTHGARKGLADTALRTSKSGYLTRRLIDVAQDLIITEEDCGTSDGIIVSDIEEDGNVIEKLDERIVGRTALEDLINAKTGEIYVHKDENIDEKAAKKINDAGIKEVKIRSPLTCVSKKGICAKCYGRDLASGQMVTIGEAVGTIAAQSIGEPGTQLTLRTFHTGGIKITGEDITLGLPRVEQLFEVRKPKKQAVISEINGYVDSVKEGPKSAEKEVIIKPEAEILTAKNKETKKKVYSIPKDLRITVEEGQKVTAGQKLTTGFVDPNDILRIQGIKAVQKYLLEQVQEVYRSQGVTINDKHIEVIVRQIARLNKIYVKASRDSELLSGELVYVSDFEQANKQVVLENEEIRNKNRKLLMNKTLVHCISGNKGDTLVDENTVIDENVINKIENSECLSFDVLDEQGGTINIVQGEINFIGRIKDYIFIGDISEDIPKTKNTKDDELRTKDLEKLKGNIITKEIALELVRNNVSKIRIYKPELSVELIGKMLAQDIKDQNEQNIIIPANTILDENDIKRIIEQQYEKIEIWSDIKEINIRENLVSIIKDDVIGKNLGKELRDETGNIIADIKQPVSKNIIRKAYSAGISDIPLEDGRFFSLEGRVLEYIYNNLVGKIIAQDITDKYTGEIVISAGDKITKNNAQALIQQVVELVKYRTESSQPEPIFLIENVGFMKRIKLPAVGMPIIQGITQASLSTESFLSGASFQRTTHVLTNASIKGKIDYLLGLKENVIIGNIIPAGTGLGQYRNIEITSKYEEELEKEVQSQNALEIVAQAEQNNQIVSDRYDDSE